MGVDFVCICFVCLFVDFTVRVEYSPVVVGGKVVFTCPFPFHNNAIWVQWRYRETASSRAYQTFWRFQDTVFGRKVKWNSGSRKFEATYTEYPTLYHKIILKSAVHGDSGYYSCHIQSTTNEGESKDVESNPVYLKVTGKLKEYFVC